MTELDDTQKRLIEEILADARRKAERVLKRAHAEAKKATQTAIDGVESQARSIEQAAAERGRAALERAMNGLPLEVRIYELTARDRYVQRVFERAMADFAAADGEARREVLTRLAAEAVAALGGTDVHLQLSPEDAKWADDAWLAEVAALLRQQADRPPALHLAAPSFAARDGVVAARADGRVRMNNTLGARLARAREQLRAEVAEILFADLPEQER